MSAQIYGNTYLETNRQEITIAPDGSAEATMVYKVPWSTIPTYIPQNLNPHPTFPSLLYYDGSAEKEEGDLGTLTLRYKGIIVNDPTVFEQVDGVISTTAEPLETAPIFTGPWGTDPDQAPVTRRDIQYVANSLASFTPVDTVVQNLGSNYVGNGSAQDKSGPQAALYFTKKLRGIDSFYRIGFTWRRHYAARTVPTYTNLVGYIVQPPASPFAPPSPPNGQNYLFTGISWKQQGGVVLVDEEYQLSGPGGWDRDLYTLPNGAS
jgi:hypothetical protein